MQDPDLYVDQCESEPLVTVPCVLVLTQLSNCSFDFFLRLGFLNVSDTYGIFRQTSFDDSYYNRCVLAPLCFPAPLIPESIE